MKGFYNSTNIFVSENKLEKEANKCFGIGWVAEHDVEQIQNLLHFIGKDTLIVKLHPDEEENDIEVCEELTVEDAKSLLRSKGYYVDNLWHINDVQADFECTDEVAQEILDKALTSEATMEQIWFSINEFKAK